MAPRGSWRFHHHPIVSLHAIDQGLVTALCRLVVRVERGEELSRQEQLWMTRIHAELMEVAGADHEATGG